MGGVAGILAPSIFGLSFAWALRHDAILHQPGLPVLLASGFLALGLLIALRATAPAASPPRSA
jgi:DHA1 family tetracycline resistance protein-like MFS transporter